jgi:hypothetical protein
MTTYAHVQYHLQHPGVVRAEHVVGGVQQFARRVANMLKAWATARRQAAEDAHYWQAALNDARIMADISRAMSAAAARDVRTYY